MLIPVVAEPMPMPNKVPVFPEPTRLTFLMALFVTPLKGSAVSTACSQMTALTVLVLRFVMVRSRLALEGGQIVFATLPLLPSIVTQSAPFNTMIPCGATVVVPVMVAVTPAAGFIVNVLTELA